MSMVGLLSREALEPVFVQAGTIRTQVEAIDDQINQEQAGPRRVRNQAADAVADQLSEFVKQVKAQIDELFGADRVGAVVLVNRILGDYTEEVKQYVEANVTTNDVELSVEEQTKLRAQRKNLVDGMKAIRQSISVMAPDLLSDPAFAEIKNLKGAIGGTGSRGPRLKGAWKFEVNGTLIAGTTLTDVKNAVGVNGVPDVRAAIVASNPGFDWETRKNFSFEMKNADGEVTHTVHATTTESDPDEDEVDADTDLLEEDSDEVTDSVFGDER